MSKCSLQFACTQVEISILLVLFFKTAETLNIHLTIMKQWDKLQIFTFLGNLPLNFCHIILSFSIKQLLLHGGKKCIFPIKKNFCINVVEYSYLSGVTFLE